MIPSLDIYGTLPEGIHRAALAEVISRFGYRSLKRDAISRRLEEFHRFIQEFAAQIYIDGSYVTAKIEPDDVDLIVVLPAEYDIVSANPTNLKLARYCSKQAGDMLHVFAYVKGRPDHDMELRHMLGNFTREYPSGRRKGIVCVEVSA